MEPKNTLKILSYISTLPLFGALLIALNGRFWAWGLAGEMLGFARLNAYIYAHAYGALLLCLIAGVQLAEQIRLEKSSVWLVVYFSLLPLSWLSLVSFADFQGVLLLWCCWLCLLLLRLAQNSNLTKRTNTNQLTHTTDIITVIILAALLAVNQ